MGRLLLVLLIVVAIVLVWKAFGPKTWKRNQATPEPRAIKGPDDDEEFLWKIEKDRFKERRAREVAQREEEERRKRAEERYRDPDTPDDDQPVD
ncbi:MAG TPA: hypothetical protein K8V93_00525 [Corynebacterium pollutisoli]|nr:hypothetical protein [Corynebacterium pollutisoli]